MSFLDNIKKGFCIGFGFSLNYFISYILKNYDNCVKYEKIF